MPEQDLHVVVGTGPVGRAVIGELVGRGLRVRAVARHGVAELPAGVETLLADITDPAAAGRAMAGAAVVYHAASAPYHRWPELLPPLMHGVIAGAKAAGAGRLRRQPVRLRPGRRAVDRGPAGQRLGSDWPCPGGARRRAHGSACAWRRASRGRTCVRLLWPLGSPVDRGRATLRASAARQGDPGPRRPGPAPHVHLPRRLRARSRHAWQARRGTRPGLARAERRDPDDPRVHRPRLRSGRQPVEAERPAVGAPQPPRAHESDSPGREGAASSTSVAEAGSSTTPSSPARSGRR